MEFQFYPQKELEKIPEKIQVSKEDLAELENSPEEQSIESEPSEINRNARRRCFFRQSKR